MISLGGVYRIISGLDKGAVFKITDIQKRRTGVITTYYTFLYHPDEKYMNARGGTDFEWPLLYNDIQRLTKEEESLYLINR